MGSSRESSGEVKVVNGEDSWSLVLLQEVWHLWMSRGALNVVRKVIIVIVVPYSE